MEFSLLSFVCSQSSTIEFDMFEFGWTQFASKQGYGEYWQGEYQQLMILQTPQDVMQTMLSEMSRPAMRSWVGLNTQVNAMKLDCPRSWKTHFTGPQQVTLSGGLLEDATSNHCYIFMLRRGGVAEKGSKVSSSNLLV